MSVEYNEVQVERILTPACEPGEFVINPYLGCECNCMFCYIRSNQAVSRRKNPWGSYVDIRFNAAELLEKELQSVKPRQVILGSTTECFQPIEQVYRLTGRILSVLNKYHVPYIVLSRSPLICEYIPLLKKGYCRQIYFSVNRYDTALKARLEPISASFALRDKAVQTLLDEKLEVIPYFSPVFPWLSELEGVFERFPQAPRVEFEFFNCRLANILDMVRVISSVRPEVNEKYRRLFSDEEFFTATWKQIESDIASQAAAANKTYAIHSHQFGDYFKGLGVKE